MGTTSKAVAPSADELHGTDGADGNGRQPHKPLTDTAVKNASPATGKPRKLYDQRGLYLEISPSGGKWWRWKYRYMGKEKRLSLGVYPEISLKAARERCDDARKLLRDGVDPGQDRKVAKLKRAQVVEDTFESVGRAWYQKELSGWTSEDHAERVLRLLERDTEASQKQRAEYLATIRAISPERLIYLDESGVTTSITRLYGHSPGGQRIHKATPGGQWKILTILGAMSLRGMIATMTVEAATDADIFLAYVERVLCPALKPGDVVVMDNL